MNIQWLFRKDLNHKWYLIPYDFIELFDELSVLEDLTLLADEFDIYLVDDIQDYIFEEPMNVKIIGG